MPVDPSLKSELLQEIRSLLRGRAEQRLHPPASGNAEESAGGEGPGTEVEGEEDSQAPVSEEPTEEEEVAAQKGVAPCAYCGEDVPEGDDLCPHCKHRVGPGPKLTKSARYEATEE